MNSYVGEWVEGLELVKEGREVELIWEVIIYSFIVGYLIVNLKEYIFKKLYFIFNVSIYELKIKIMDRFFLENIKWY